MPGENFPGDRIVSLVDELEGLIEEAKTPFGKNAQMKVIDAVAWSPLRLISPVRLRNSISLTSPRTPRPMRTATSCWARIASSIWVSPSTTRSSWTRRSLSCASPIAAAYAPLAASISTLSNAIAPLKQRPNGPLPRKIHLQH